MDCVRLRLFRYPKQNQNKRIFFILAPLIYNVFLSFHSMHHHVNGKNKTKNHSVPLYMPDADEEKKESYRIQCMLLLANDIEYCKQQQPKQH